MRGVVLVRAVLVDGVHHPAASELLVGADIDLDTADRLIREGCAVSADETLEEPEAPDAPAVPPAPKAKAAPAKGAAAKLSSTPA